MRCLYRSGNFCQLWSILQVNTYTSLCWRKAQALSSPKNCVFLHLSKGLHSFFSLSIILENIGNNNQEKQISSLSFHNYVKLSECLFSYRSLSWFYLTTVFSLTSSLPSIQQDSYSIPCKFGNWGASKKADEGECKEFVNVSVRRTTSEISNFLLHVTYVMLDFLKVLCKC